MIQAPQLVFVPCPLCGGTERFIDVKVPGGDTHLAGYGDIYAGRRRSEWKICGACGFVHQNPRPSTTALDRYYLTASYRQQRVLPPVEAYRLFAEWYYGDKVRYVESVTGVSRGTVMDVGCGYGAALAVFAARGWRALGLEADAPCCEYARAELGLDGVQNGLLDENAQPPGAVDVVFSNHAFEHVADLDQVMKGVVRLLKPGGFLVTVVPTYYSNRSSLSKRWMNSAHYSLFTDRSLSRLCAKYGLETVAHTYRGWRTEIDELWHVARYAQHSGIEASYHEDGQLVDRYLRITNPLRSAIFFPLYAYHSERRQLLEKPTYALKLLFRSPSTFVSKVMQRFGLARPW